MNGFKNRLYQFMQGRRGFDELGKVLIGGGLILLLLSNFLVKIPIAYNFAYYLSIAVLVYGYYRAFSKNLHKREMENRKFLSFKQRRTDRKTYVYFNCPGCGQQMRVPKRRGTIEVNCHKCNTKFMKKV